MEVDRGARPLARRGWCFEAPDVIAPKHPRYERTHAHSLSKGHSYHALSVTQFSLRHNPEGIQTASTIPYATHSNGRTAASSPPR